MSPRVRITEVAPRDGLQNEAGIIPTADKVRLIELCAATGVDEIEVTSFVSPKWIPQLADGADVVRSLRSGHIYSALVPNLQGLDAALAAAGPLLPKVSVFTAASETFSRKNTNASIAETLARFAPVIARAHDHRLLVRAYISCAISCPFEGPIAPAAVARLARQLVDLGADEIDLGDTIGAGTPESILALLTAVRAELGDAWWSPERMTLHLHDTFGRAADCVRTALDLGIRSFDSSVAGLGGCPYASTPTKRAPGNISTEALVRTIQGADYETGVNLDRLREAAAFATKIVAAARARAENRS